MVDTYIFKPVSKPGSKIFIYNGIAKGNERNYGKELYEEVVKRLPNYEYIYSNELGVPNEKMPEIYSQCFIGLRLTPHDGNANMVQEMEAMGIPVIHNFSKYGIKYESIDDIILNINLNHYYTENKMIIYIPYCKLYKPYINKCIDSVLKQNYENYEIIIVNDGDKNCDIENNDKISILHFSENKGPGHNKFQMFKYFENNRSDYTNDDIVVILDGDDYLIDYDALFKINLKSSSF